MFKKMTQSNELEANTRIFWEVSRSFNGKSEKDISTATAITLCSESVMEIAPWRPLARRFQSLERAIIIGRSRKKQQNPQNPQTSNITQLKRIGD